MAFLVNVTHVRSYKTINVLVNNLGYTEVFHNTRSSDWDWAFFRKCEYLFTFLENASFLMLGWVSECASIIHTHRQFRLLIFKLVSSRFRLTLCIGYTFICTFFSTINKLQYNKIQFPCSYEFYITFNTFNEFTFKIFNF